MKIINLATNGYGKFKDENWTDFSPGINVFYGENEAGKSTVFKMMTDLIFGFQNNKLEKNSVVNRSSNLLNVKASLSYQNEDYLVKRDFDPNVLLTLQSKGKEEQFKNIPLPMVNHISRQTYEEVYALDINRLSTLKDSSWEDIEDLLLQQYSSNQFTSSKKILTDLEQSVKEIKKSTDRGNSLIKSLEQERREVFREKKLAQEKMSMAEEVKESIERLEREIDLLKSKKVNFQHQLNELEVYLPIMNLMNEKEALEEELNYFLEHKDLTEVKYKQYKNEVRQSYVKLDHLSEKISHLISEKRSLLELIEQENIKEDELNDHHQKQLAFDDLSRSLDEQRELLADQRKVIEKEFENTFDEAFDDHHIEIIQDINYLNLKSLIQEIESVYEDIKVLKRNKRTMSTNGSNSLITFFVLLMISSGVVFYLNLESLYNYISVGVFGGGLVGLIHQISKKRNKTLDENALFAERDALRKRILVEIKSLRVSSIVSEFIGQEFLTQILSIKKQVEQYSIQRQSYDKKLGSKEALERTIEDYLSQYQMPVHMDSFKALWQMLTEQKKHEGRVEIINQQLASFNEEVQAIEETLNEQETWLVTKEAFLKQIGQGDLSKGVQKMVSLQQDVVRLKDVMERIDHLNYNPIAFNAFLEAYKKEEFVMDKASLQMELELISKSLNDRMIEHVELKKDFERLMDEANIADINSKLASIDQEIEDAKARYDQLLLMHHVIKNADESFRLKNQPEVFKNAGQYLSKMTNGKYYGLEVVELVSQKKKFEIQVLTSQGLIAVDETFSLGTVNQIYLSLRLSLIDHLDGDQEALPICFDELLINWDQNRLESTLEIIDIISRDRQVMIFTCHEWLVQALQKKSEVNIYTL